MKVQKRMRLCFVHGAWSDFSALLSVDLIGNCPDQKQKIAMLGPCIMTMYGVVIHLLFWDNRDMLYHGYFYLAQLIGDIN